MSTATLERPFAVGSVREEISQRGKQKRTEPAFPPIDAGIGFVFDLVGEKALREILRIMHRVPAAAHEIVKRRPIGLAKLPKRGLRDLRFGLTAPRRENHAPVGGRKQIALAMPVPSQGFHINGLYRNRRRKASPQKKRVAPPFSPFGRDGRASAANRSQNSQVKIREIRVIRGCSFKKNQNSVQHALRNPFVKGKQSSTN